MTDRFLSRRRNDGGSLRDRRRKKPENRLPDHQSDDPSGRGFWPRNFGQLKWIKCSGMAAIPYFGFPGGVSGIPSEFVARQLP